MSLQKSTKTLIIISPSLKNRKPQLFNTPTTLKSLNKLGKKRKRKRNKRSIIKKRSQNSTLAIKVSNKISRNSNFWRKNQ